jgi:aerobic-type carbon monoxide dehydrogenase small subunit (CoxS/CutS family)
MCASTTMRMHVNGAWREWDGDPLTPLVDVLREGFSLTGTKIGCRTGDCGACTVLINGVPALSCIWPVAAAAGDGPIRTIEDLRESDTFRRLVDAMLTHGGTQCGFCTPGIMVTLWAWAEGRDPLARPPADILKNNLCRCTGYGGILAAATQVREAEEVTGS